MKYLSIDAGGTFIKYAWLDEKANILSQGKKPTPRTTKEDFLAVIKEIWGHESDEKCGICLSLPGTINTKTGFVHQGGSLTYHHQLNIKKYYEDELHTQVEVENDARCAALAAMTSGHMQGIQNRIVLTFGTGVGGGIILNGEIYKGHHLIAGEVSVIYSKDPKQYQSKGLFGAIGSIYNLVDKIAKAKNSETHDGKEVFNWIGAGDKMSQQIFKDYCDEVVLELHNIQCLLDPERICIGGGISENPLFIAGLQRASDEFYQRFPIAFPHAEIVKCQYCNDANMLGAYYHYKKTTMKV